MKINGKVSWFGGPNDQGVSPDEPLAFISQVDQAPHLFLSYQPSGTTGLARRLNPEAQYIACRWNYSDTPKQTLLEEMALITATKTGKSLKLYPADWGPHEDTGRIADISPGAMELLGIQTDDEVSVEFPFTSRGSTPVLDHICISPGHGLLIRGASGILDEVNEARRVVEEITRRLRRTGVHVKTFADNTSTTQNENLNTLVAWHNSQDRDLDISIHFNAYIETTSPMGTECLYVTQNNLATHIASAIAGCGFINRGAKKRTDLYFLNQTFKPSILIEVCFVDSAADADVYNREFEAVCTAMAGVLGAKKSECSQNSPPSSTP